ncbi:MAG: RNA-guided pseudouridylation complex pseudouridine synthase subunit Cbf5 [Candidatus Aenigmarchaeota archaeon]|nr:RNA-guided pseudouridylation complex pseudouridine synthase subunit Cbf5 [Candidatus Aenigmarchaeota archaeon]MDW8149594.1 RNA-guided pseudouridylation complex pseudouridine synthase subunit Cbf5 [Candidatus Aenigmarchaeota archaeon]
MSLVELTIYESLLKEEEITFEELINRSILLIDKHKGPTSFSIDKFISKILSIKKVGHAGTLDPNASGLLPILLGKANKAMEIFKNLDKEYIALAYFHSDFTKEALEKTITKFIGEIIQVPPVRSAVARKERKRKVYSLEILEIENRNVLFKISCEAGLYVRKLIHDIGKEMKIGAHLKELRRTKIGNFLVKNAISIYKLKQIYNNKEELKKYLIPIDIALSFLKKVFIKDNAIKSISNGYPLYYQGIVKIDDEIKENENVAIYALNNKLIAIGKSVCSAKKLIENKKGMFAKIDSVLIS